MVQKFVTGLAISVGAGLAVQAAARQHRKGGQMAKVTPVTIRVHTATLRPELVRAAEEHTVHGASQPQEVVAPPPSVPDHSIEFAELRMMIENLDKRTGESMTSLNQRIDDLQNHLPRFIDVKVSSRLREVEERLRTEFQDEQSKTLDAFLKTLDSKVLPRLSTVEEAIGHQGEEIGRMRSRIDRNDETIATLVARIDKVVDSLAVSHFPGYASSQVYSIGQKAVA